MAELQGVVTQQKKEATSVLTVACAALTPAPTNRTRHCVPPCLVLIRQICHVSKRKCFSLYLKQAGRFVTGWRWIIKQSFLSGGSFPSWLSHGWSELNQLFLSVRGKMAAICVDSSFISRWIKSCCNRVVKANVMTGHQKIKIIATWTFNTWQFKGQRWCWILGDTAALFVITSCFWFSSTQVQIANKNKKKFW